MEMLHTNELSQLSRNLFTCFIEHALTFLDTLYMKELVVCQCINTYFILRRSEEPLDKLISVISQEKKKIDKEQSDTDHANT